MREHHESLLAMCEQQRQMHPAHTTHIEASKGLHNKAPADDGGSALFIARSIESSFHSSTYFYPP